MLAADNWSGRSFQKRRRKLQMRSAPDTWSAAGGAGAGERLLSTLLTEMDGLQPLNGVLVVATTNRPQARHND